jgi:hypothetical protein
MHEEPPDPPPRPIYRSVVTPPPPSRRLGPVHVLSLLIFGFAVAFGLGHMAGRTSDATPAEPPVAAPLTGFPFSCPAGQAVDQVMNTSAGLMYTCGPRIITASGLTSVSGTGIISGASITTNSGSGGCAPTGVCR